MAQLRITDCGAANLVAAIFGVPSDNIKRRLGLPILPSQGYHPCPNCDALVSNRKVYCDKECQHDHSHIKVECACGCGKVFTRYQSQIIWGANHPQANGKPQERLFYARKCRSRWIGKHYGFGGVLRKKKIEVL